MKSYDVMVIGSGCGAAISEEAAPRGLRVAMVDRGPLLGGTCLNWGCIPSKMLIYAADRIVEIQDAAKLGIEARIENIDFRSIMERMRKSRRESQRDIRAGIEQLENLDFYEGEGHFVDEYVLEVNGEKLKGEKVFIASGSRPLIPPIEGLARVPYLTNETALELDDRPDSLIIIGGGYIAVEYGHFFAAVGTRVTILEMADRLVLSEEPEISDVLKQELSKRMVVRTNAQAKEVKALHNGVSVTTVDRRNGQQSESSAQQLMMAVGRRSNADLLEVSNTGIELDNRGFIKVNEYMETSKKNIYAIGDANGQQMFTHMANSEASIAARNAFHGARLKVDYTAVPHAVYSHPQIASVGLREEQARQDHEILVGRTKYFDIAKGEAMLEEVGYAKVILERGTDKILGFHIIGPYAPELIQEVVNAMTSGDNIEEINRGIHIHPALSELVPAALGSLGDF